RVDFSPYQQPHRPRDQAQDAYALDTNNQLGGVDAATSRHHLVECERVPCNMRGNLSSFRLERLDDFTNNRNLGRACFFALVARDTVENAAFFKRASNLPKIIARVERGLRELHQRPRTSKIGESAQSNHRTR